LFLIVTGVVVGAVALHKFALLVLALVLVVLVMMVVCADNGGSVEYMCAMV
jgi:hypothetical protein